MFAALFLFFYGLLVKQFISLFLVAGLLALGPARAQSWQWAVCPGGTGYTNMGRALATDAQGNVFVAGATGGAAVFGSVVFPGPGATAFVGKLNPAGQWLWAVGMPSSGTDLEFDAAVTDAAGNLYLTGRLTSTRTFGSTTLPVLPNHGELFVAKLNPAGQWLWAVSSTGNPASSSTDARGLALAYNPANGDVAVAGQSVGGSISYGSTALPSVGNADALVARLSGSTGQWLWATAVASSRDDEVKGVAFDAVGNVLVAGYAINPIILPPLPFSGNGSRQGLVAKLSANGQTWLWVTRFVGSFGFNNTSTAVAALPLPTGEVAVVGKFVGNCLLASTVLTSAGDQDIFVGRLDGSTGNVVAGSARRAGGPGTDDVNTALADPRGSLLLGGRFNAPAGFGTTTYNPTSPNVGTAYVARYLVAAGTWTGVFTGGSNNDGSTQALTADPTGTHVYAAGLVSSGTAQFGALPPFVLPTSALFVARLGGLLATRPAALGGQAVQLWPNPATGTCAVRVPALPGTPQVATTLLDGLGRAVRPFTLPSGTTTALDLAGVPAGLYMLRLAAGAETTALRLAVE